jgi:uncharacterized protein with HEPN domain
MEMRVAKRLHDALIAAQRIERYVRGRTYDDYVADDYFRSAVERQFEILSEALKIAAATDTSLLDSIPQAPKVIGMRNRIATVTTYSMTKSSGKRRSLTFLP